MGVILFGSPPFRGPPDTSGPLVPSVPNFDESYVYTLLIRMGICPARQGAGSPSLRFTRLSYDMSNVLHRPVACLVTAI